MKVMKLAAIQYLKGLIVDKRKGDDNIRNTHRLPAGQGMKNILIYFVNDLTWSQNDNMNPKIFICVSAISNFKLTSIRVQMYQNHVIPNVS